ncbi:unnamed protein product [Cuscuta campestris]|uniref:Retroviral polymerase SH3-like domain-containing protein n=1 Tax=Cuscuta campestris TaxID=132261 RepID=A0A484KUX2_9ASTE|nr:unnamed protein product [Cuscuta campestris]
MVWSMISLTTFPESFWGYALKTAAHTLNRVPSKAVKSTPYELWRGRKPSFSYFKIWGCEAYVKRLMMYSKLEPKSDKVIFVGYPKETRGYEFYHPSDNKIFVARNGTFLEKEFLSAITSGRKVDLKEIREPQEEVPIVLEHEQRDQAIEPQTAQDIPRREDSERLRALENMGRGRRRRIEAKERIGEPRRKGIRVCNLFIDCFTLKGVTSPYIGKKETLTLT